MREKGEGNERAACVERRVGRGRFVAHAQNRRGRNKEETREIEGETRRIGERDSAEGWRIERDRAKDGVREAGRRARASGERERKREDVNFLAVRSFVRSTKCECIIHGLQGTLIFCRGRVVGRGGPLGGRRFHGRGKRVVHRGDVHEHRRELEGEPARESEEGVGR